MIPMKKSMILALLMAISTGAWAQQEAPRSKSVYLELAGPSNGIGISYDARFKPLSPWGYRVGLSWTYSKHSGIFASSSSLRGYSAPIEVNYLVGKRKHHLEIGVGANLGIYNEHYTVYSITGEHQTTTEAGTVTTYETKRTEMKHNTFGYFVYGNIGYRYQTTKGFQLRAGISPSFNFGDSHGVNKGWFFPYISFGKAF